MNEGQIIPYIVFGVICGFITDKIRRDKGYVKSWFWWGFFFQILAILIALGQKPAAQSAKSKPQEAIEKYIDLVNQAGQPKNSASWNCICGRQNRSYTGTCACGRTKDAVFEEFESRQRFAQSGNIEKIPVEEETVKPHKQEEVLLDERAKLVQTLSAVISEKESPSKPASDSTTPAAEEMPTLTQPDPLPPWSEPEPLPIWTPESFREEMIAHEPELPIVDRRREEPKREIAEPQIQMEPDVGREKMILESSEPKVAKVLTKQEVISLLSQAEKLPTADEIYSVLRKFRDDIKTQEFDALIQELQNDAAVERAYGNNKNTAMLHIDLYRNNSGMQTDTTYNMYI